MPLLTATSAFRLGKDAGVLNSVVYTVSIPYYDAEMQHTIHTHTHPFIGPLSGTIRVSWYQKVKPVWILLKQETMSGSGISWAICKSARRSRQITKPAPHHSVFYRLDVLPATRRNENQN